MDEPNSPQRTHPQVYLLEDDSDEEGEGGPDLNDDLRLVFDDLSAALDRLKCEGLETSGDASAGKEEEEEEEEEEDVEEEEAAAEEEYGTMDADIWDYSTRARTITEAARTLLQELDVEEDDFSDSDGETAEMGMEEVLEFLRVSKQKHEAEEREWRIRKAADERIARHQQEEELEEKENGSKMVKDSNTDDAEEEESDMVKDSNTDDAAIANARESLEEQNTAVMETAVREEDGGGSCSSRRGLEQKQSAEHSEQNNEEDAHAKPSPRIVQEIEDVAQQPPSPLTPHLMTPDRAPKRLSVRIDGKKKRIDSRTPWRHLTDLMESLKELLERLMGIAGNKHYESNPLSVEQRCSAMTALKKSQIEPQLLRLVEMGELMDMAMVLKTHDSEDPSFVSPVAAFLQRIVQSMQHTFDKLVESLIEFLTLRDRRAGQAVTRHYFALEKCIQDGEACGCVMTGRDRSLDSGASLRQLMHQCDLRVKSLESWSKKALVVVKRGSNKKQMKLIKKGLEEMKRDMVEGLSEMRRFLRHHQVRDGDKRLSGCIKSIFDLCDGLLVPGRPPIDQDIMFQFITAYHLSLLELCFDVFAPMPNQDEAQFMSFWQLDPETSGSTSVVHPEDFDCKAKNVKVSIKEEEETAHSKRISRQHASTDTPTKGWITSSPSAHARPQRQLTFSRLPAPNKVIKTTKSSDRPSLTASTSVLPSSTASGDASPKNIRKVANEGDSKRDTSPVSPLRHSLDNVDNTLLEESSDKSSVSPPAPSPRMEKVYLPVQARRAMTQALPPPTRKSGTAMSAALTVNKDSLPSLIRSSKQMEKLCELEATHEGNLGKLVTDVKNKLLEAADHRSTKWMDEYEKTLHGWRDEFQAKQTLFMKGLVAKHKKRLESTSKHLKEAEEKVCKLRGDEEMKRNKKLKEEEIKKWKQSHLSHITFIKQEQTVSSTEAKQMEADSAFEIKFRRAVHEKEAEHDALLFRLSQNMNSQQKFQEKKLAHSREGCTHDLRLLSLLLEGEILAVKRLLSIREQWAQAKAMALKESEDACVRLRQQNTGEREQLERDIMMKAVRTELRNRIKREFGVVKQVRLDEDGPKNIFEQELAQYRKSCESELAAYFQLRRSQLEQFIHIDQKQTAESICAMYNTSMQLNNRLVSDSLNTLAEKVESLTERTARDTKHIVEECIHSGQSALLEAKNEAKRALGQREADLRSLLMVHQAKFGDKHMERRVCKFCDDTIEQWTREVEQWGENRMMDMKKMAKDLEKDAVEWAGSQRTEGNLLKQRMTQELKAFVQNLPKVTKKEFEGQLSSILHQISQTNSVKEGKGDK